MSVAGQSHAAGSPLEVRAMRSRLVEIWSREGSAEPDCSVIVPVYDGARFLAQSIPAVLAQSDIVCDILISDDCSSDSSL